MSVICYLLAVYYLIAVYLCYSSVKISVSAIQCLGVYISLGDAALATIRVMKISCYCNQNAASQIAQNGLADLESAEIDSAQLLPPTHNKQAGHLCGSAHAGAGL